jgi:hypothetical protein
VLLAGGFWAVLLVLEEVAAAFWSALVLVLG